MIWANIFWWWQFWWNEGCTPLFITKLGWWRLSQYKMRVIVECELVHLWPAIIHSNKLLIQVASPRLCQYHQTTSQKIAHWSYLLLTVYALCYLNMLAVVRNLTKKYPIHYSTGLGFDRCSLDRRDDSQKKAHKLNIHLDYSH